MKTLINILIGFVAGIIILLIGTCAFFVIKYAFDNGYYVEAVILGLCFLGWTLIGLFLIKLSLDDREDYEK